MLLNVRRIGKNSATEETVKVHSRESWVNALSLLFLKRRLIPLIKGAPTVCNNALLLILSIGAG